MSTTAVADPPARPTPAAPLAHTRRIVLTGFMGAGKSTLGRLLAHQLGWEFLDLDDLVEQAAGMHISEIFATEGEGTLRRLETRALARALGRSQVVIALGGGAPETLTNRLLLEQTPATTTIYLEAPFPVLFDRCMLQALLPGAAARPNLADPQTAELRFTARQVLYRRLAHHTLPVAELSPDAAVGLLLRQLL